MQKLCFICAVESFGMGSFTDGLWHYVSLDVLASQGQKVGRVNMTVDSQPYISERQLTFTSASTFYIGGMFFSF